MSRLWFGTTEAMHIVQRIEDWRKANVTVEAKGREAFFGPEDDDAFGGPLGESLITKRGAIGILSIRGTLVNDHSWIHDLFPGEVTSYQAIGAALDLLAEDEDIERVVLDISSGGGMVTGLAEMAKKITRLDRSTMRVDAHTSTHAFSAAYWIAASARNITATEMAEVGSIGTLRIHQSVVRAYEQMGVDTTIFRAGEYKALGHSLEELSDKAKEYFQADVETANAFFLNHVSSQRNLMVSNRKEWAEGKTFFAMAAKDVGLIDQISSMEEIISASGASTRRQPMFMSEHKRAQIEAGAKPEDVLTPEELTAYNESLEREAASGEEEGTEAKGETETVEPTEGAADNGTEADAGTEAGTEAPKAEPTIAMSEYRQVVRENAKLAQQLETAQASVEDLTADLSTMKTRTAALHEVAATAVDKLNVALRKPARSFESSDALVAEFNSLQAEMAANFGSSKTQHSKGPGTKDAVAHTNVPAAFRHLTK